MSVIDTSIRCFEKETFRHLLTECSYTQDVWRLLGINANDIKAVLGTFLTRVEFEIHADLSSTQFKAKKVSILVECADKVWPYFCR